MTPTPTPKTTATLDYGGSHTPIDTDLAIGDLFFIGIALFTVGVIVVLIGQTIRKIAQ